MSSTDFAAIAAIALRAASVLLPRWLPGGKQQGHEYDVRNPTRDDHCTGNFRINTLTGKWADFATDAKGRDLISLYAYLQGLSQIEALEEVSRQLGITATPDPAIAPFLEAIRNASTPPAVCLLPIPDDAPPPPLPNGKRIWRYRSVHNELLGYVVRFDKAKGKEFRPLTYWSDGWRWKTWPRPAPLYGVEALAKRIMDPVLVVEGEKTADAAATYFPDFVAITWPGGSSNAKYADWKRLAGRSVWLLPDADDPGKKAMAAIAEALRGVALAINLAELPADLPSGWDVADADFANYDVAKAWFDGLTWHCLQPPPQSSASPRFDDATEKALARGNGKGPRYEAKSLTTVTLQAWPHPLPARLEAEILRRVPFRSQLAARITTKAILAHLVGRQVVSQSGDPTQLYLALVAQSVSEVRGYLHAANALLDQIGVGKSVRQARLSNPTQLFKALYRSPSLLYLCAEWGITLAFAKRQPAGSLEQTLTVLSDIWDGHPFTIDQDEVKLKDFSDEQGQSRIPAPHLTMLATLSQEQLANAVKLSEAGRGALDQIQYWVLDEEDLDPADPETLTREPYPDDLIADLKALLPPGEGNLAGHTGAQPVRPKVARFSQSVTPLFAPLDALPTQRQSRSLVLSARFISCREATTLAFLQAPDDPQITSDLLRLAVTDEVARLSRLLNRFDTLASDDGKLSAYQRVLDFITAEKGKGASERTLARLCWAYKKLKEAEREALIQQLLNDGALVETYPPSQPGARRKAVVYLAAPYAKESQ